MQPEIRVRLDASPTQARKHLAKVLVLQRARLWMAIECEVQLHDEIVELASPRRGPPLLW
eukprot:4709120-Heterocapsa_arctica.AAC.1